LLALNSSWTIQLICQFADPQIIFASEAFEVTKKVKEISQEIDSSSSSSERKVQNM